MKNVLMVAYHYPPEGGSSGVLRALKFSKYLPVHGWRPHVLTLRESFYPVRDTGLLGDVPPEAVIHRTSALDTARHLAVRGRHLAVLAVPDRFVSWLPFAVARGLRVIRAARINALYSTSPPATAHLIAGVLNALTGVAWAADFRDPWIEEGVHPRPGTARYRLESRLERWVIDRADRLVVTTPYLRGDFLSRYPRIEPDRVRVIYNGYDEEDFVGIDGLGPAPCFELIHAGLVTPEYRNPLPVLEEIVRLIADGELPRDEVRVTFLGGGPWVESPTFTDLTDRLGLRGVVGVAGRVSHRESLERLARAAVLLLLQASEDTRSLIPAKTFEYLRVGRPILAVTLDGATADILKGMERCSVVSPDDRAGLREDLMRLFAMWKHEPARVDRSVDRFGRRTLTAELAEILDGLAPGVQHGGAA